jgi:hypothetical protein
MSDRLRIEVDGLSGVADDERDERLRIVLGSMRACNTTDDFEGFGNVGGAKMSDVLTFRGGIA